MKGKYYTFFIASSASGEMRRLRVPFYLLHGLAMLACGRYYGSGAMGSYSRMLWKAAELQFASPRAGRLKQQYKASSRPK